MRENTLIGKRIPRIGSVDKVLGRAQYSGDIILPRMLCGRVLRSPYPHAKILNIDTSKAEKLPGVKAVVTGKKDTPRCPDGKPGVFGIVPNTRDQVLLPIDKVRYVGEEVAAVAGIDEDTAEEAIELIDVEYEPLPFVLTAEEAMKEGAPLIHENVPGNIAGHYYVDEGNVEEGFRQSDYIYEDTFTCCAISHALPEPYTVVADYDPSNTFHVWAQTQCPFQNRQGLSNTLLVSLNNIRLHNVWSGAAYGGRSDTMPVAFIACLLARKAKRPVKITLTREEVEETGRDRAAKIWTLKQGLKRDGTILAREIKMSLDCGAYASSSIVALWVPLLIDEVLWRAPNYRYEGKLVYTNKTICSMMRSRANVGPMAAEIAFDKIAEDLGLDPIELRLKNAMKEGEVTPTKSTIHSSGLSESIVMAAEKIKWKEKKGRLERGRGIGIGSGNMQAMFYMGFRTGSTAFIKFNDDGSCTVFTGNTDNGQGNPTMHVQVAAEELGIPMEDIKLQWADTELSYQDPGTYSMSATVTSANAVKKAAADAKRKLFEFAGHLLDVSWEEVEMKDKMFYVKRRLGKVEPVSIAQVCRTAFKRGKPIFGFGDHRSRIDFSDFNADSPIPYVERTYGQKVGSYSFGTTAVEVEVDIETGKVTIVNCVAINDCGRVLNPLILEGLMDGQIALLLGHGLMENNVWDPKTGRKLSNSYRTYKLPTSLDMPKVERGFVDKLDADGPYGAKEGGLGFGVGLDGAIANAIHDAVGIWVKDLPITSEQVLRLIKEKEAKEKK